MSLQISSLQKLNQSRHLLTAALDDDTISPLIKFHYLESILDPWYALIDGKFKFIEHYIKYLNFQKLPSSTPLNCLFKLPTVSKKNPVLLDIVKDIFLSLNKVPLQTKKCFILLKDENNLTIFNYAIWNNRADIIKYLLNNYFTKEEKFDLVLSHQMFNTNQTIFHIFAKYFNIFDILDLLNDLNEDQRTYILNLKDFNNQTFIEIWNAREVSNGKKL
jgi:ankyrin repeat protein